MISATGSVRRPARAQDRHDVLFIPIDKPGEPVSASSWRWPRRHPAARTSAEAVCLMDLYPTLAELTGLEVPPHVEGAGLTPLLRARQRSER